jgi:hypothetical protein
MLRSARETTVARFRACCTYYDSRDRCVACHSRPASRRDRRVYATDYVRIGCEARECARRAWPQADQDLDLSWQLPDYDPRCDARTEWRALGN